jgi:hypothetical protein
VPANESTKIQINYSTGKPLINLYADDEIEAAQLLESLNELAPKISEVGQALGAVLVVTEVLGGQQVQDTPSYGSQQPQAGAGAPFGVDPEFCSHGTMKFRSGTSKAGKPYEIFDCPVGECESKWPKKKR